MLINTTSNTVNQSTLSSQPGLQNGPENQPEAVGPSDNNDDFTNKSTDLPVDLSPTATFNPTPVNFTNTLNNQSTEDTIHNTTVEKLYTGFLRVVKESRILKGTGRDVPVGQETYSTNPKTPASGNIIEYRITYTNICEPGGSNSSTLYAENFVITEDGTTDTSNWAKDNDGNGVIDTSNVVGSATDPSGTITFTPADQTGTTAETDVTRYVNTVTNPVHQARVEHSHSNAR